MRGSDAVMVSSGDDQEMVLPLWLRSIASAKLYCSCETHPSELRTFYCRVCGVAVCNECKERHNLCNHEMIKAYKASKGPSFRRDDLEPLWDISDIYPYSQNGCLVAYIPKRGAGMACSRSQSGFAECKKKKSPVLSSQL
ncbi:uncharacterized protein LOC130140449 [Syzygium oleosum]|uniref:uncharacterized protein LOC130140449 n=1 Tax=Syzygium oleosum TaxID=219896 RepID=UPI0024B9147C|nr:uncharacterized protein LOC130140449 [Syzygium oleosum]